MRLLNWQQRKEGGDFISGTREKMNQHTSSIMSLSRLVCYLYHLLELAQS